MSHPAHFVSEGCINCPSCGSVNHADALVCWQCAECLATPSPPGEKADPFVIQAIAATGQARYAGAGF